MKKAIKLEDFEKGDISIECENQEQVYVIGEWSGMSVIGPGDWTGKFKYVFEFCFTVFTWDKPRKFNYKFSEVELI